MTTDPFTKAARAEAEKTWPKQRHGVHVNPSLIRDEMVRMAVWARDHLAAQGWNPPETGSDQVE